MSLQIPAAFVEQFTNNVTLLSQQRGSRLRDRVYSRPVTGDASYFERIGPVEAQPRTTRHGDSPSINNPHSRRRLTLSDWVVKDYIDHEDEVRMLIDPRAHYTQNFSASLGRKMDDIILAAALGSATAVSSSLTATTSTVSLPSGQIIDEDFGTSGSNLTVPKLIEARRIMMKNEVDVDYDELTFVYNASAMAALLNTTQVTSADYNTVKALVHGEMDTFLGFKFIHSERLAGVADGTDSSPVLCMAFAKSGIGFGVARDMTVRVAEDPGRDFSTVVHATMTIGAVRIEEAKVVQVECVQSS